MVVTTAWQLPGTQHDRVVVAGTGRLVGQSVVRVRDDVCVAIVAQMIGACQRHERRHEKRVCIDVRSVWVVWGGGGGVIQGNSNIEEKSSTNTHRKV